MDTPPQHAVLVPVRAVAHMPCRDIRRFTLHVAQHAYYHLFTTLPTFTAYAFHARLPLYYSVYAHTWTAFPCRLPPAPPHFTYHLHLQYRYCLPSRISRLPPHSRCLLPLLHLPGTYTCICRAPAFGYARLPRYVRWTVSRPRLLFIPPLLPGCGLDYDTDYFLPDTACSRTSFAFTRTARCALRLPFRAPDVSPASALQRIHMPHTYLLYRVLAVYHQFAFCVARCHHHLLAGPHTRRHAHTHCLLPDFQQRYYQRTCTSRDSLFGWNERRPACGCVTCFRTHSLQSFFMEVGSTPHWCRRGSAA